MGVFANIASKSAAPSGGNVFANAAKNQVKPPTALGNPTSIEMGAVAPVAQGAAKGAIKGILQGVGGLTALGGTIESGLDKGLGALGIKSNTAAGPKAAAAAIDKSANQPGLQANGTAEKIGSGIGQLADMTIGPPGKFLKTGAEVVGDVGGKLVSDIAKSRGVAKEASALQKSISDTMPFQNKGVRIDELRNTLPDSTAGKGGVAREGLLGKSTPQATEEDITRGKIAHEYINGVKDPVTKIANVNQGIRDTSKAVDSFLDEKAAPSNFADMRTYMETNHPPVNLQKDATAMESYNRATQDALDTLYKTMKEKANKTGDFGPITSGAEIRKARIAIDGQIAKELGENTFGTPQYKGIKAAEISTRNLLNRMTEDMLRYPGQLENVNKLNEALSAFKGRGIEVDMTNPEVRAQLEKTFGLKATPESIADAEKLASRHSYMSHLYDARDNMIDKYQSKLGKNQIQEAIANNPVVKGAVGVFKKAIPFGVGSHF